MLPERLNAARLQRRLPVSAPHTFTMKFAGLSSLVVVGPVSVVFVSVVGVVPVLATDDDVDLSLLSSPPLVARKIAAPTPPTRMNAPRPASRAIMPLRRPPPPPPPEGGGPAGPP